MNAPSSNDNGETPHGIADRHFVARRAGTGHRQAWPRGRQGAAVAALPGSRRPRGDARRPRQVRRLPRGLAARCAAFPAATTCRPRPKRPRRRSRPATATTTCCGSSAPRASTNNCAGNARTCAGPGRRNHLMYAVRHWSVRHARGLSRFYAAFEALLVKARAAVERIGYERLERPVAADRARRQGTAVRLPDVRAVRAELDRHGVPDELPEAVAQRTLRRRARERQLRSGAGDALRLGRSLARRRTHPGGLAAIQQRPASGRSPARGHARRGLRVVREKRGTPA